MCAFFPPNHIAAGFSPAVFRSKHMHMCKKQPQTTNSTLMMIGSGAFILCSYIHTCTCSSNVENLQSHECTTTYAYWMSIKQHWFLLGLFSHIRTIITNVAPTVVFNLLSVVYTSSMICYTQHLHWFHTGTHYTLVSVANLCLLLIATCILLINTMYYWVHTFRAIIKPPFRIRFETIHPIKSIRVTRIKSRKNIWRFESEAFDHLANSLTFGGSCLGGNFLDSQVISTLHSHHWREKKLEKNESNASFVVFCMWIKADSHFVAAIQVM